MCFHEDDDLRDFLEEISGEHQHAAAVVARDPKTGSFAAGFYVKDARNNAQVAQAVSNLQSWHPNLWIDLSYVNFSRSRVIRLTDLEPLPPPNMKSADDDPLFAAFMAKREKGTEDAPASSEPDFDVIIKASKLRELQDRVESVAEAMNLQLYQELSQRAALTRGSVYNLAEDIEEILEEAALKHEAAMQRDVDSSAAQP